MGNQVEKIHDSVPSPTDILTDKTMPDSRALVAVPAMSLEALAVVPMNMKTNRADLVQRRTRRPFSVSEVEALVHAVEELGTGRFDDCLHHIFHCYISDSFPPPHTQHSFGFNKEDFIFCWLAFGVPTIFLLCRWRDVKLRAFDNAKHRTYVDLKVRNLFCYFTVHNWTKPLVS